MPHASRSLFPSPTIPLTQNQNWSLLCALIEVSIEVITISIYAVVFYRFWSKRRLRKSMALRDEARESLYLAQLRSAPTTAGFLLPPSARDGGWNGVYSAGNKEVGSDAYSMAEEGRGATVRYLQTPPHDVLQKPFVLQPAPTRTTPKLTQGKLFNPPRIEVHSPVATPPQEMSAVFPSFQQTIEEPRHQPAASGERQYDSVPIPGAYAPLNSPI